MHGLLAVNTAKDSCFFFFYYMIDFSSEVSEQKFCFVKQA